MVETGLDPPALDDSVDPAKRLLLLRAKLTPAPPIGRALSPILALELLIVLR